MKNMTDCNDKLEIAELIRWWAYGRDNGDWERLAQCFTDDGQIAVTWFHGRHADFVAASRARHGRSMNRHVMLGTVAEVSGARAWAESAVQMLGFARMDDTPVRWLCHFRFIDELVKHEAGWKIQRRSAVYDLDALELDGVAGALPLDRAALEQFPRGYRYLGYRLARQGLSVPLDLPTSGSPAEAAVRAQAQDWVRAG